MNGPIQRPLVICATGAPLHSDALRSYLNGFYEVIAVRHSSWRNGLQELDQQLATRKILAIIIDDTFPYDAVLVAERIKTNQPTVGLIFMTDKLNIFKVLRCLEAGYVAYLYLGDPLADTLKQVIERARRGERFLSQTVLGMYERYTCYRGLFISLPEALASTFKLSYP